MASTPSSLGGGPPSSGSQVIPKYPSQRPRSTSSSDKSEEISLTNKAQSGCSPALSPARSTVSSNSLSPPPNNTSTNSNASQAKDDGSKSSLSALSSMFESIGGSGGSGGGGPGNHSDHLAAGGKGGSANSGISQQGHHPLAALQKLCDIKADVTSTNANSSRPTSTSSNHSNHSYRDGHFSATSPGNTTHHQL